jgi:hypothetical protein
MQPAEAYLGWIILEAYDYTSYYHPSSYAPVLIIADIKKTFDSWMQTNSTANNSLLIQLMSFTLDRRLDPILDPSPLVTGTQALQREINRVGIPYLVSGSTDVPWENGNGGTSDGRKVFYPNIPYQNVILGTTNAARVIRENMIYYFILDPNGVDYVRIIIQPTSSTLIPVAEQILSSFAFTHIP